MMYQKIIVPIDHGNRNMKTEHKIFTSGFLEGDCRPALGEYLQYDGRYYALTEQRIPYMRDKTLDDRFFILTLFVPCSGSLRIILRTEASSSLSTRAFLTGLRLWKPQPFRRIMRLQ